MDSWKLEIVKTKTSSHIITKLEFIKSQELTTYKNNYWKYKIRINRDSKACKNKRKHIASNNINPYDHT